MKTPAANNVGARVERGRIPRCYGIGIYLVFCMAAKVVDNQINFIGGSTNAANATGYGIFTDTGSQTIANNSVLFARQGLQEGVEARSRELCPWEGLVDSAALVAPWKRARLPGGDIRPPRARPAARYGC